ncbi:hypothetical protein [Amphibacillus xylanus]|uniref:Lipoprotein n=1 Tax=Amphibacillus xylanus (strain ATCC 51415 / DSM 6626 / JCM 7361 / LMG 17667 / NBRC 15112 / Ep01) TaxID=698758 RepID=K0J4R7_AMPXN|nr:hypothetical protein [Amphibacillus xylanus]BAM47771.1 hypothetical protein AXY_16390 [Amphibacillus xylanus NBRC 15112]
MTTKKIYYLTIASLFILLLVGCQNDQASPPTTENQQSIQNISYVKQDGDQINASVRRLFKEINEITSISNQQDILMAIQVKPLSQFNEQKTADEVEAYLSNTYSDMEVNVSSDYKIFLEINRLKKKIAQKSLSTNEINEAFNSIKTLINPPSDQEE